MNTAMSRAAVALGVLAACSGGGDDDKRLPPPPAPTTLVAPPDAPPAGTTRLPTFDPAAGLHLDDGEPTAGRSTGPATRSRRTLEILLRSTPSGALVFVDGQALGRTPTYWEGEFTGREREFAFVLPGHVNGRYRFVPITNGIVHARLDPLAPGSPLVPYLPPAPPAPAAGRKPTFPDARPAPPDASAPVDGTMPDAATAGLGREGIGPAP